MSTNSASTISSPDQRLLILLIKLLSISDIKSHLPHAFFMCFDEIATIFLTAFDNAGVAYFFRFWTSTAWSQLLLLFWFFFRGCNNCSTQCLPRHYASLRSKDEKYDGEKVLRELSLSRGNLRKFFRIRFHVSRVC